MDLQGKCVLLGVTGGIAAYKMANVASALKSWGADVEVIMTENATHFITPLVFETLTGHKCMVDTFDRDFKFEVTHISLAKRQMSFWWHRPRPTSLPKWPTALPMICSPPWCLRPSAPSWSARP